MGFSYLVGGVVDDIVDAVKVVDSLNDIVDAGVLGGDAEGVGFEYIASLLFCKAAAFDVVGVVGKVYLCAVVDAALHPASFLFR